MYYGDMYQLKTRDTELRFIYESRRYKKFYREIEKLVASNSGYAETRFPEFRCNVKLDL